MMRIKSSERSVKVVLLSAGLLLLLNLAYGKKPKSIRLGGDLDEDFETEPNWTGEDEYEDYGFRNTDDDLDEDARNIALQLRSVSCPAQPGLKLRDYWKCLWKSSLTVEGFRQERNRRFEGYTDASWEVEPYSQVGLGHGGKVDTQNSERSADKPRRRVKRQETQESENNLTSTESENNLTDWIKVLQTNQQIDDTLSNPAAYRECQFNHIKPGEGLKKFFECLRDKSTLQPGISRRLANVPLKTYFIKYDTREFNTSNEKNLCPEGCTGTDKQVFNLTYTFTALEEEDTINKFDGADPYVDEQNSPYRFKYDNLARPQRQPGWSYNGLYGSPVWHNLNHDKFYLPLTTKGIEDLEKAAQVSDFAQTYPGTGEVVEALKNLDEAVKIGTIESPMDNKWNKDKGYHIYTRYLVPLLTQEDVEYYQYKGAIEKTFTIKGDVAVIQDIVDKLTKFKDNTSEALVKKNNVVMFNDPANAFPNEASIPFVNVYRQFFHHYYYDIDIGNYRIEKFNAINPNRDGNDTRSPNDIQLHNEYDFARRILEKYLEAVIEQQKCLIGMLKEDVNRKAEEDVQSFLDDLATKDYCRINVRNSSLTRYFVPKDNLQFIYDSYYDRKQHRKRYTLPLYPFKFPICRHNEPSPVNIITTKGRKSSLPTYFFGDAAYRLNRFFMMFPNDGSNLLSIGIVDGQRLDDSSVRLNGGAVKGQNLTFQFMYLRFGKDWLSGGSEHLIDGIPGQMELQMVFSISGSADTLKYWHILARVQNQIFQFREKLVIILSILVDVVETHEELVEKIKEAGTEQDEWLFEPYAQAAYLFRKHLEKYPNEEAPRGYVSDDHSFRFINFIPKKKDKFYTYRGSLSWPPCFGYVIWSVFRQRLYMSKRQFDEFTKIPSFGVSDHNRVSENFRRTKDIYVEEEGKVSHAVRQEMIRKRTVDRLILEGEHEPVIGRNSTVIQGVVSHDMYYVTGTEAGSEKESSPAKSLVLILLILQVVNEL